MEKTLSYNPHIERTLALSNLSQKKYRTVLIGILVAVSAAVLFASLVLSSSLKAGIAGLRSCLGADLLVVPAGYEKNAENILLTGEPNYFYMERSVLDRIRSVEGVEKASAQFYLTSLAESCCDFPVQIIGFEPESDFIIQTWSKKRIRKEFGEEFFLCGNNVTQEHGSVRFFDEVHKVSGRLLKTGSGMDNVIFCDFNTLQNIFDAASKKGFGFISDGDTKNKISTVLIRLSPEASASTVALRIKNAVPDVQVIQSEKFIRNFSQRMGSFLVFFHSISVLVLLITIFSMALVFSIMINERRREFSILRVLGADRSALRKILLYETAFIGGAGAFAGITLAALAVIPFNALLSEKISLPFAMCGTGRILIFATAAFLVSSFSCVLAAVNAVFRIAKIQPYGDVK